MKRQLELGREEGRLKPLNIRLKQNGLSVTHDTESIKIILHNTIVVQYRYDSNELVFFCDGWVTPATRKAINTGLDYIKGSTMLEGSFVASIKEGAFEIYKDGVCMGRFLGIGKLYVQC